MSANNLFGALIRCQHMYRLCMLCTSLVDGACIYNDRIYTDYVLHTFASDISMYYLCRVQCSVIRWSYCIHILSSVICIAYVHIFTCFCVFIFAVFYILSRVYMARIYAGWRIWILLLVCSRNSDVSRFISVMCVYKVVVLLHLWLVFIAKVQMLGCQVCSRVKQQFAMLQSCIQGLFDMYGSILTFMSMRGI